MKNIFTNIIAYLCVYFVGLLIIIFIYIYELFFEFPINILNKFMGKIKEILESESKKLEKIKEEISNLEKKMAEKEKEFEGQIERYRFDRRVMEFELREMTSADNRFSDLIREKTILQDRVSFLSEQLKWANEAILASMKKGNN
jgi:chromosome segregation ATPase